jgi:hypothetical protein
VLAQPLVEAAHTGSGGGLSVKDSDYSCFHWVDCHTLDANACHRIGKRLFKRVTGDREYRLIGKRRSKKAASDYPMQTPAKAAGKEESGRPHGGIFDRLAPDRIK